MDAALRALNRFGLGARPGEASSLGDPRGWLEAQLDRGGPPLRAAPPDGGDPARLVADQREAARGSDPDALADVRRRIREGTVAEARDALSVRVATDRPFVERLVAFWSNHLCVSGAGKLPTALLAGAYEREAIRPHALGRFEDLVLAATRHPAMLTYLDNVQSVGPGSRLATAAARRRRPEGGAAPGLNENHARELLELHTVGVDGGYDQDDVRELARVLTGWTVRGLGGPGARFAPAGDGVAFAFVEALHEPGSKTVLGRTVGAGGVAEGEAVIRHLCRHPATARFVATKLVRHFVADDPPPAAVDRVAAVFRDSDGDLRETARAVARLEDAWDPAGAKFRTPQDWLVALLRAVGADEAPPALLAVLRELRHPLWAPPSPAGYPDTLEAWGDPDALMNRAELARSVSRTVGRRAGRAPERLGALAGLVDRAADDPLPELLADPAIPVDERVALAFAGPAFQWR